MDLLTIELEVQLTSETFQHYKKNAKLKIIKINKMRSFSTYIHLYRKNIKMSLSSNLVTMKHMLVVEKNIKIW